MKGTSRRFQRCLAPAIVAVAWSISPSARAQEAANPSDHREPSVAVGGYLEAYYGYNFNRPSNGLTNYRAFDNRNATITLANAVLSVDASAQGFYGRIALQSGSTGETYYGAEPARPGADGAAVGGPEVFKHVQEAYAGFELTPAISAEAGLYLSPIGPEAMAIKDTWLWSRSNLFYGLPFYHTGARIKLRPSEKVTLRAGVLNGWNSVVDNNDTPSVSVKATLELSPRVTLDAHYLGGIERDPGAPEGPAWRNLFDTYLTWRAHDRVELIVNSDAGMEPNRFGLAGWAAGALYGRVRIIDRLFVAARGDVVFEKRAGNGALVSAPMLFPTRWLTSQAVAVDFRPVPFASVRLEYRHDAAASALFFSGNVSGNGTESAPFVANARAQNTLTLGMTAWF